ncbi:hypothetical protein MUN76_07225 [Leucobacter rhizosphaerae]|uniref:Uncharacterized protein n=1 Tax=Leucobacter rhizosphaerae TaxID=2932245 RepID=A0ABY4FZK6_9MICO|nr:hypothetical protein [Leucobacter rhizosphaerae]UOQ61738.1 hypothetical protein MUN76_07225 [Leucobacter rhizosphaerae]
MRLTSVFAIAAAGVLAASLAGCGGTASEPIGGDVIAPVTMSVNELQGETVDLVVGQVLNISTDSLAVDSYTGEVSDTAVAEFTEGRIDDSAEFNPGVTALAAGSTEVTMTNEQGGIQPLTFTVVVTDAT